MVDQVENLKHTLANTRCAVILVFILFFKLYLIIETRKLKNYEISFVRVDQFIFK